MRVYPAAYLQRLREACDQHGLLLIADEIAVGFGRTGAMFACELAGIRPDIMAVGKGLTGGMLPMSATLVTDAVYDTFRADASGTHTLHHGTTFCGNPITSAVALAALAVYEDEQIIAHLATPARRLQAGMARANAGGAGKAFQSCRVRAEPSPRYRERSVAVEHQSAICSLFVLTLRLTSPHGKQRPTHPSNRRRSSLFARLRAPA